MVSSHLSPESGIRVSRRSTISYAIFVSSVLVLTTVVPLIGCRLETWMSDDNDELVEVESFIAPDRSLPFMVDSSDASVRYRVETSSRVSLRGRTGSEAPVWLRARGGSWDLSDHSVVRLDVTNGGDQIIEVTARLRGTRLNKHRYGYRGNAIIRPGESQPLIICLWHAPENYEGAPAFEPLVVRPNGHRRRSDAYPVDHVGAITLDVSGPGKSFTLENVQLSSAYPTQGDRVSTLEKLPLLDRYGQLRAVGWKGKVNATDGSLKTLTPEDLASQAAGLIDGTAKKTISSRGFSVEQRGGSWTFIDPQGDEFWSLGVNAVGTGSPVRIWKRRSLFESLPAKESSGFGAAYSNQRGIGFYDFYRANLIRRDGPNVRTAFAKRVNHRFSDWGFNTLGSPFWEPLLSESRLPFTIQLVSQPADRCVVENVPDPFDPGFGEVLSESCQQLSHLSDLPRCLGVFVDKDLLWPDDLVASVFRNDCHARDHFVRHLRSRYESIEKLNQAWNTQWKHWEPFEKFGDARSPQPKDVNHQSPFSTQRRKDYDQLYRMFADQYYAKCATAVAEFFPDRLYLGSRLRQAPSVVLEACAKHVDVISLNRFDQHLDSRVVPDSLNKPVLISRFHVGSMDGGAPGWGNLCVANQTLRSRSWGLALCSAIKDPRVVGVHWDTYCDQSPAAQPGQGNRAGIVDVTDQPYPQLTTITKHIAQNLDSIRRSPDQTPLECLETILAKTGQNAASSVDTPDR